MRRRGPQSVDGADLLPQGSAMIETSCPSSCPTCGSSRIRTILWFWTPSEEINEAIRAERIILGSQYWYFASGKGRLASGKPFPRAPSCVCLDCEPRWSEVHRLAIRAEELDLRWNELLSANEWEAVVSLRPKRESNENQLFQLVCELLIWPIEAKSEHESHD